MINADHAALEGAKEVLSGVHVLAVRANIFATPVKGLHGFAVFDVPYGGNLAGTGRSAQPRGPAAARLIWKPLFAMDNLGVLKKISSS
jgi:hypothetical protein